MVDPFLIIVIIVAFVILFVVGVYFVVYYQHPDDKNEAYLPKFVVIFGFVLAGATVLLLPLDVANNEGYAGTLRDFCVESLPGVSHECPGLTSNDISSSLCCLVDAALSFSLR